MNLRNASWKTSLRRGASPSEKVEKSWRDIATSLAKLARFPDDNSRAALRQSAADRVLPPDARRVLWTLRPRGCRQRTERRLARVKAACDSHREEFIAFPLLRRAVCRSSNAPELNGLCPPRQIPLHSHSIAHQVALLQPLLSSRHPCVRRVCSSYVWRVNSAKMQFFDLLPAELDVTFRGMNWRASQRSVSNGSFRK
jgi:hypothetical protein